ncbi:MAG: MerC domain-containing protein [Pseudomonadota bacterium]
MAGRPSGAAVIDGSAITLSGLCLIHCLLLPVMSAALPIAGVWAEAEWLHRTFVIAALPIAVLALASRRINFPIGALIVAGCSFLVAGAFVEAWHDYEVPLTTLGALLLAAGHSWSWFYKSTPDQS